MFSLNSFLHTSTLIIILVVVISSLLLVSTTTTATTVAAAAAASATTGITPRAEWATSDTTTEYVLQKWKMFSQAAPTKKYDVNVPTTVLGGLVEANDYPFDIYKSQNLKKIDPTRFALHIHWIFETSFNLSESDKKFCAASTDACSIRLLFDGINYEGNVTYNGETIADNAHFAGALRRFEFDVTSKTRLNPNDDQNTISVSLRRQRGANRTNWRNPSLDLSIDFLDWMPSPPDMSCGLYRPVHLLVIRNQPSTKTLLSQQLQQTQTNSKIPLLRLDAFVVHTQVNHRAVGGASGNIIARLNVSFAIKNVGTKTVSARSTTIRVDLGRIDNSISANQNTIVEKPLPFDLAPNEEKRIWFPWDHFPQLILDENVPLWYPFQMIPDRQQVKAPLFNASAGVVVTSDDSDLFYEIARWRYGIRSSETRMTRGGALQFYINDQKMLVRGGGYCPDMLLRMDRARLIKELSMIRSMGLNQIRLEGMMMTTEFYDICDELQLTVTPGWPCCSAWQEWLPTTNASNPDDPNPENPGWGPENYVIADESMKSQARRFSWHPSVVGFYEGSDTLPIPRVEKMYTDRLVQEGWPNPIISSAEGWYSNLTGNSGVKMSGIYSWVPPSYWINDSSPLAFNHGSLGMNFGGAYGFLTEAGPGAAVQTFNSWNRTVDGNAEELWDSKLGPLGSTYTYHCGMPYGHFANLSRFVSAQDPRYGTSTSARQFLFRSQISNFEGIRSMFEAYSRNRHINATGIIQWQINKGWPSNLWNLYDYYHVAHGGFFGAKQGVGHRPSGLHVMMNYLDGTTALMSSWFIDFSKKIQVSVKAQIYNVAGKLVWERTQLVHSIPADAVIPLDNITIPMYAAATAKLSGVGVDGVYFVRLSWSCNKDYLQTSYDINWYWLSPKMDIITMDDFWKSKFYYQPVSSYANFRSINNLPQSNLIATASLVRYTASLDTYRDAGARYYFESGFVDEQTTGAMIFVEVTNKASTVCFFTQIRIVDKATNLDVTPTFFNDNFFSLAPGEKREITAEIPLFENAGAMKSNSPSEIASRIRVEIETYNDIVAQEKNNGILVEISQTTTKQLPSPPIIPPASSSSGGNTPSSSGSGNSNDETVPRGKYVAAVSVCVITSILALIATYSAVKFYRQSENAGSDSYHQVDSEPLQRA